MTACRNHEDREATWSAAMPAPVKQPSGEYVEDVPLCSPCAERITAIGGFPVTQLDVDPDLSDCPYFGRYIGAEGHDPEGTCSYGCRDEPACVTDRPLDGWPAERIAVVEDLGGG